MRPHIKGNNTLGQRSKTMQIKTKKHLKKMCWYKQISTYVCLWLEIRVYLLLVEQLECLWEGLSVEQGISRFDGTWVNQQPLPFLDNVLQVWNSNISMTECSNHFISEQHFLWLCSVHLCCVGLALFITALRSAVSKCGSHHHHVPCQLE